MDPRNKDVCDSSPQSQYSDSWKLIQCKERQKIITWSFKTKKKCFIETGSLTLKLHLEF